ncbi:MAG: hypothetical protein WBD87_08370 [Candidatus Acidiferrales bacterium]
MILSLMLLLSIALLLALIWLLFGNRKPKTDLSLAALEIKRLLPIHCGHFPQIRHILTAEDREFVRRRAPQHIAKQWRAQRRRILRLYIQGLGQDFHGLEQLARLIAALSPEVKRKQEWEWAWISVQFRLLYGLTLLHLALHRLPDGELARLTELLSSLTLTVERWIDHITEALPQVQTNPGS